MLKTLSRSGISGPQPLSSPELVVLEMAVGSREEAIELLAGRLHETGRVRDLDGFIAQVKSDQHQLATGLPGGIGIPHARTGFVDQVSIAVGITAYGHTLDFGASDGPASVVLLLATPKASFSAHLNVLAALARSLSKEAFRESLRRAYDTGAIAELINSALDFSDL
ncbi:PTS sugar transporter subunit IIA [Paeniglutamicibacter cryotolerans]|uniref:PTS system fructose-specific IIA component n=1 Tax=Paeniglutamicibacter cryotolerans TaxID=670079 RepID=A0A839QP58_9MICC|nr:PTS sugar transporter subunit IIA [Paeniglutamicibacter cryotolerans]MBB2993861.1 PTS system fructose-specific IIA component [Paeniglutamicibacter cryotolerans]